MFDSLSKEIKLHTLKLLDLRIITRIERVSKNWKDLISDYGLKIKKQVKLDKLFKYQVDFISGNAGYVLFSHDDTSDQEMRCILDLVNTLLKSGADPGIPNDHGNEDTLLHWAFLMTTTEIIIHGKRFEEFIDILLSYKKNHINKQNREGDTPLHLVAKRSISPFFVKKFLEKGANPNLKDNNGNTVLDCLFLHKFNLVEQDVKSRIKECVKLLFHSQVPLEIINEEAATLLNEMTV